MHARTSSQWIVGAALAAMTTAGAVQANESRASFAVTATVRARALVTALDERRDLAISEEDVLRGYTEVSVRYLLRQHGSRGCLIRLAAHSGAWTRVEVSGLTSNVVITGDLVEVFHPDRGGPETLDLRLRLLLDPRARTGHYPFPLVIDAVAL
jgi:hypothetical protein